MALKCHLVVFARLPRFGAGKRRLAKGVGAVEALRFQRTMLGITLRRLSGDQRWITWLAMTPTPRRARLLGVRTIAQGRGSLGDRMAAVARAMPPGPVVIVGSDIPGISAASVAAAFRLLGSRDAVFGPAVDGGYWLVGLRRRPRFVAPFVGVRWSSQHALEDTLANLPGYSVGFVQTLEDVDDATALKRHLPSMGTFARRNRIASARSSAVDQTCPAPSP
jgi:rSAM/selenodomain-associated transferase 1